MHLAYTMSCTVITCPAHALHMHMHMPHALHMHMLHMHMHMLHMHMHMWLCWRRLQHVSRRLAFHT